MVCAFKSTVVLPSTSTTNQQLRHKPSLCIFAPITSRLSSSAERSSCSSSGSSGGSVVDRAASSNSPFSPPTPQASSLVLRTSSAWTQNVRKVIHKGRHDFLALKELSEATTRSFHVVSAALGRCFSGAHSDRVRPSFSSFPRAPLVFELTFFGSLLK